MSWTNTVQWVFFSFSFSVPLFNFFYLFILPFLGELANVVVAEATLSCVRVASWTSCYCPQTSVTSPHAPSAMIAWKIKCLPPFCFPWGGRSAIGGISVWRIPLTRTELVTGDGGMDGRQRTVSYLHSERTRLRLSGIWWTAFLMSCKSSSSTPSRDLLPSQPAQPLTTMLWYCNTTILYDNITPAIGQYYNITVWG